VVEVKGATVQAILRDLVRQYPVMQPYLFHEDETIRDEVGIAVNAVMTDNNPLDPVPEGAEIHLVPAIAGGSSPYRVPARPMHLRAGVDLTRALRLAESLEDDEIVRKLDLRR
jgi:molybdopterin converting factor small subunit